ncbi:MAG: hypothetical protein ACE5IK_06920 [Acidobacteriota bacterium]
MDATESAELGGGFQSNHVFLNGPGSDMISPYSGDVETMVPIGPALRAGGGLKLGLMLHHSSKLWRLPILPATHLIEMTPDPNTLIYDGILTRRGAFGVGWRLHLGRVYKTCSTGCNDDWVYESPDGAQHPIAGVNNFGNSYTGTTDSTHIRAEQTANGSWVLYMGNGVVRYLDHTLAQAQDTNHGPADQDRSDDFRGWYTTKIEKWDAPNHPVGRIEVTYENTPELAHCIQRVDFQSLDANDVLMTRHSITFDNSATLNGAVIEGGYTTAIHVPAVSGQASATATYQFAYEGPVNLSFAPFCAPYDTQCHAEAAQEPGQFLLSKIVFPFPDPTDQASYPMRFTYDTDPNVGTSQEGASGELLRKTLPTGATIAYEYGTYFITGGGPLAIYTTQVDRKKVFLGDPDTTSPDGTWVYDRYRSITTGHTFKTTVTNPFGDDTVYEFGSTGCPTCIQSWLTSLDT